MTKWSAEQKMTDTERNSWSVQSGPLRIWVGQHINNPSTWTFHCPAIGMDAIDTRMPIESDPDGSLGRGIAVNMVTLKLRELASALRKIED